MIGVVGAGVTGLSLSVYLEERRADHVVLEARPRAGGVIRSSRVDGRILDYGPQRTRATPAVSEMVGLVGLEHEVVTVDSHLPLFVYRGGRLRQVPFSPGELIRTDLLSWRGKLRLLLEPLRRGPEPDETVARFLVRKFGREAYESLMGPLFGGLYGSDPADMFVRHSLAVLMDGGATGRSLLWRFLRGAFNRRTSPPAISFRDGMEAFVEAMLERVRHRVRLETPAARLKAGKNGDWILRSADGDEYQCSDVVLTLEAERAADLLEPTVPDAADRLRRLHYNDLALVHLVGECPLEGLGYQISFKESFRTRGVTWNASALKRKGIYTAFLGGSRDPDATALPDDVLKEIAAREFRVITGCRVQPLEVSRTRIPAWDRSWTALDDLSLPSGLHLCSNYESRVGLPGRLARARELAARLTRRPGDEGAETGRR